MTRDSVVAQDPSSVASGLFVLVEAFLHAGDARSLLQVVHFMLDNKLKVSMHVKRFFCYQ